MTLHDLSNSPDKDAVSDKMALNRTSIEAMASENAFGSPVRVKMCCNSVFNMVGTSIVLGLRPADEQEYLKLMKLYSETIEISR